MDKRVAKKVAMVLNNNHVGGKKHGFYHDDLWNIKYLRKFRWTHIAEKTGTVSIQNFHIPCQGLIQDV